MVCASGKGPYFRKVVVAEKGAAALYEDTSMYAYVLHMYECHDASETVGSQVIVLPFLLLTNGNMRTKVLSTEYD